ncbi:unnamed protein product, partial [Iphiclides podalirius]
MEDVRSLCRSADVVALQETWLLPHDLPLLNTIDEDFGCTGTSAVDTTTGPLKGRPYGGVALLWRKSAFESVSVVNCNHVRGKFHCAVTTGSCEALDERWWGRQSREKSQNTC